MAFVRFKDREQAYQPELQNVVPNTTLSLKKKIKPKEFDPYADQEKFVETPVIYLPAYTQNKRVEQVVISKELEFRKKQYPTMIDRIQMEKDNAKEEIKLAREKARKDAFMKRWQDKILREEGLLAATTLGEENQLEDKETEIATGEEEKVEPIDKQAKDLDELDEAEFKQRILEIQEQKYVKQRNPIKYHREMPSYDRSKMALKLALGYKGNQDIEITEVLPWMYVGTAKMAKQQHELIKLGFTHILNTTDDVDNFWGQSFVYKKINISDTETSDFKEHFPACIEYIQHIEKLRAKVFIHCTAGASRAPTAALAFLIADRKISLNDAFTFLRARRVQVRPNRKFLFNLAELEIEQGLGSSVLYHPDWRFYEFNLIKNSKGAYYREPIGIYKTVVQLYTKIKKDDIYG